MVRNVDPNEGGLEKKSGGVNNDSGECNYHVVFRGRRGSGKIGGYEGIVTMTSYHNEEEFRALYDGKSEDKNHEIVAQGVSMERAEKLIQETSALSLVLSAFDSAYNPVDNTYVECILKMKLGNVVAVTGSVVTQDYIDFVDRLAHDCDFVDSETGRPDLSKIYEMLDDPRNEIA
jgi:hypothetical protein